jgi:hypothetical protein
MTREAIEKLLAEGWSLVPVPAGAKAPSEKDWINRTFTADDFPDDSNVGVRLGKPSGGLTDIDLDVPQAVAAARTLLPLTERIHGRPSTGPSHYWYAPNSEMKSERWLDLDGKVLIEIRSTGGQTIIPESTHPSGEQLYWEIDRSPAHVDPATLRRACRMVACAALLARHWPSGSRHVAARDAAGFLAARELDPREIEEIIGAAATAAGDDEIEDRRRVARDTAKTFAAGGKTTGGPTLESSMGADVVKRLVQWFGGNTAIHDQMVAEMNERHFYTALGARTVIAEIDPATGDVVFKKEGDLYSWYANKLLVTGHISKGDRKGQEIKRSKFEIWREHPKRREYARVVFAPHPRVAKPDEYNLWTGLAVSPAQGDCSLFLAHLRDNLCRGNEEHYAYLLDLMAFTVQFPGIPSEIAVLLKGNQGTGKGIFARYFGKGIFGRHYLHLDNADHVTGHFNAHLSHKIVVFADEAFFAGDKRNLGTLKRSVTEDTLTITPKGLDSYQEDNHIHLFMATNDEHAVRAAFNERRFFVLNVSDAHMQDLPYFGAITRQMHDGGLPALLKLLLERSVTHDRIRAVPKTDELRIQQELSMTPEQQWFLGVLYDGSIGPESSWPARVSYEELYQSYLNWCDSQRILRRVVKHRLGYSVLGPWLSNPIRETGGARRRLWSLMPLAEARATFDREVGIAGTWPEIDGREPEARVGLLPDDSWGPEAGRV